MTAAPLSPRRRRERPSVSLTLVMLAFLAYFLLPLVWLVLSSTKTVSELFTTFGLWFADGFHLADNIRAVLAHDDGIYLRWLGNTALYALVSAGGAALLATLGGYGFAKYDFPGKKLIYGIVLGSILVPSTSLAVPTYLLFARLGLVDSPLAVILPSMLNPFGVFLMRVYAEDAVPDSLLDAARIDGAGELAIFLTVAFRLLLPGFVTVLLFTLVTTWNNYFLPLIMLSDPRWYPVTVGLDQWNALASAGSGGRSLFHLVITGSLLSILPLMAAFLFLQRYWRAGLATGAIKG